MSNEKIKYSQVNGSKDTPPSITGRGTTTVKRDYSSGNGTSKNTGNSQKKEK